MKIKKIVVFVFIFLATQSLAQYYGENNKDPEPPPCGLNFELLVVDLGFIFNEDCNGGHTVVGKPEFGDFGTAVEFKQSKSSILLQTNVDISGANFHRQGYIHFIELSKSSAKNNLPPMEAMIVDIVIYSGQAGNMSLLVFYQNDKAEINSIALPLGANTNFDVSLAWVNEGCISNKGCNNHGFGSIELKVTYENGDKSTQLIEGISYNKLDGELWSLKSIYWGELDKNNVDGELILSLPNK